MQWWQWVLLSADLTPADLCRYRPSDPVYCWGKTTFPATAEGSPSSERGAGNVTDTGWQTLNSDNRKLMHGAPLKAQRIACGTLKLTRLSRWHMLILWLWPQFHLWVSASGSPPILLAHWPHKDRPCRYWSRPVNTNVSGLVFFLFFASKNKSQYGISNLKLNVKIGLAFVLLNDPI